MVFRNGEIFSNCKQTSKCLPIKVISNNEFLPFYHRKFHTAQKIKFSIRAFFRISSEFLQETAVSVTFTEEIFNQKLDFLCSVSCKDNSKYCRINITFLLLNWINTQLKNRLLIVRDVRYSFNKVLAECSICY